MGWREVDVGDMNSIHIVSFPRSGSTWLNRLLADFLSASTYDTNRVLVEKGDSDWRVYKSHAFHPLPGPTIHILRDPRDVAVSSAHYRCMDNIKDVLDGKDARNDYLGFDKFEEFTRTWMARDVYRVRYEELSNREAAISWLRDTVETISNQSFSLSHVTDVYNRQTFVRARDRHGDYHSMWRGVVGAWRHFDRQTGERFDEQLGELMLELGYIKNRDWWRGL
jgi:hypothetical protein